MQVNPAVIEQRKKQGVCAKLAATVSLYGLTGNMLPRQMLWLVLAIELLAVAHAFSITPSQGSLTDDCPCIAAYYCVDCQLRVSRTAWSSSNHAPRKAKQLPWTQTHDAERSLSNRVLKRRSSSSDASETVNGAVQAPADTAVYERVLQQFLNALAKDEEQLQSDTTAEQYVASRVESAQKAQQYDQAEALSSVTNAINTAMQRRLVAADGNLRGILTLAPDLKKMEGMLRKLYRTGQIDIAYNVVLNMNLAQAREAGDSALGAVAVLTHLNTKLMEWQDDTVSPAIKLLRVLMRAGDSDKRKDILREQLDQIDSASGANDSNDNSNIAGTNGDSSSSSSDNSDNRNAVTLQDLKLAMVDLKQQALQLEQASTSSKDFESGIMSTLEAVEAEIDEIFYGIGDAPRLTSS
eukprot:19106-Heterococcus_DN1.PRE.1